VPFVTDAWAGTWEAFVGRGAKSKSGRTAPRTDTPMHLPNAPEPAAVARRRRCACFLHDQAVCVMIMIMII
jgi:hypothetical protein